MTPKTSSKKHLTGPLTPLEIGHFSFRDGVWYVQSKPTSSVRRQL